MKTEKQKLTKKDDLLWLFFLTICDVSEDWIYFCAYFLHSFLYVLVKDALDCLLFNLIIFRFLFIQFRLIWRAFYFKLLSFVRFEPPLWFVQNSFNSIGHNQILLVVTN